MTRTVTLVLLLLVTGVSVRAQGNGVMRLTNDGISYPVSWQAGGQGLLITQLSGKVPIKTGWQLLTDLWQVDLTGNQRRLALNASYPALSPDGQEVAYLSFNGSELADLYVLDFASGQVQHLAQADWGHALQWSPTGQGIIFVREGRPWLVRRGGGKSHPLAGDLTASSFRLSPAGDRWAVRTHDGLQLVRPGKATVTLAPGQSVSSFSWSPQGDRLAYVVGGELWTASSEGLAQRQLVQADDDYLGMPRWAPDGRQIAVIRTPLRAAGTSENQLWIISADGSESYHLSTNLAVDDSPLWSPDGRWLAVASNGDVFLLDVNALAGGVEIMSPAGASPIPPPLPAAGPRARSGGQLTPPATIRVLHHPNNTCRDVPAWQIDVIDFETYVKRVVPREMPAGWNAQALQAQAVAARTYAWRYVLQNHPNYDVNDSTGYQLMCDAQDPRSDAAVEATRGEYIAYEGQPILAEYSAENSSPTVSRAGYPYLQAVDDPVSFGEVRIGHGRGMGQTGAQRWASSPYGWVYQQILSHYYTGVSIEVPAGPASDATPPVGTVTLPWSGYYLTSNRALLRANASDDASGVAQADFWVRFHDGAGDHAVLLARDSDGSDGWQTVWDLSALPDQPLTNAGMAITVTLRDAAGNEAPGLAPVHVGLDRVPPGGTMDIPVVASQTISVPVTLGGSDAAGGSGLASMAFSNDWRWEESAFARELIGGVTRVGHVISDSDALNGSALFAQAGSDPAGAWYGPYTNLLPAGHPYRAYFRLKTDNVNTAEEVAYLDVVDDYGQKVLGIHRLRGLDFRQAGVYQEFAVDFNYTEAGTAGLEFRTAFRGVASLWLDRVLVVSYPQPFAATTTWTVADTPGWQEVTAKLIDGAGNVSADLRDRVYYLPPVIGWRDFRPAEWVTETLTPTAQVGVQAAGALDPATAVYRYSRDGSRTWSGWEPAVILGTAGNQALVAAAIPFEQESTSANRVQFRVTDQQGHSGISPAYVVPIDVQPPVVTTTSPPLVSSTAFTVTWAGEDATSGVAAFDVQMRDGVDGTWQDWVLDTTRLSALLTGERGHRYYFRARARDVAGNQSDYAEGLGQTSTLVSGNTDAYLPLIRRAVVPAYPYPAP